MRLLLRHTALFWGLLLIGACRPEAEERGRELVRREMPALEQAATEVLGDAATTQLFAHWSETAIAYYRLKNTRILDVFNGEAAIPSVERLYASLGREAYSSLGEVYGIAHFGAHRGSAIFYDEIGYDAYNAVGRRPDGLLVRIEPRRLMLLQVFESKLGSTGFDRDQAKNYLEIWKTRGIVLPVNGVTRHFSPGCIVVRDRSGRWVPIVDVDNPLLESQTTLVHTREHPDFLGTRLPLPMTAADAKAVVFRWLEILAGGRVVASDHANFVVPPLDTAEEVFDYRESLSEWLLDHGTWPKTSGKKGLELFLSREISRRQGQARAFIEDLDPETQMLLALRGVVPALRPFEGRLVASAPRDPGVTPALDAYRAYFEKSVPDRESTIVRLLTTRSPYAELWRQYFAFAPPPSPPPAPPCGESFTAEAEEPPPS